MAGSRKLQIYRKKRDFRRTAEPAGGGSKRNAALHFVVQKHAARRLHYDFRLELDGVLLSWAVPKGPSLNPKDLRLAVQTEDHPLEYEDFEGVIPAGEYGGGTVMLWDRGVWEPEGNPREGYKSGRLRFRLQGRRLKGSWTLARKSGDEKNWLLIKRKDSYSRNESVVDEETRSVATNRTMEAISKDKDRTWSGELPAAGQASGLFDPSRLTGARTADLPSRLDPQKATLAAEPPASGDWLHELKYDGYRIIAFVEGENVRLVTRNHNDWTGKLPALRDAVRSLALGSAVLDGELVSPGEAGTFSFQGLQAAIGDPDKQGTLAYYIFDLPYLNGYDLRKTPLRERKQALSQILNSIPAGGMVRYSDHVEGKAGDFFAFACRSSQEGIICKFASGPYRETRSKDWLKVKCVRRQEFVIGGYTKPGGSRTGFGSLLLGVYENGGLRYCGRVGTGFSARQLASLSATIRKLERKTPPFTNPPREKDVHWAEPELVAEVTFSEWTQDGHLRHPSFKGLREDKPAAEVIKEEAAPPVEEPEPLERRPPASRERARGVKVAGVPLSTPDRTVFPEESLTKQDVAEYYEAAADWMLPHVAGRPLMVMRCPQGRSGKCFYQKHSNGALPEAVKTVRIKETSKERDYIYIEDLRGLISMVQFGTLEFHPWGSRVSDVESPDRVILDLDPDEGVEWPRVVKGALHLRELLGALGLESFVKTTGGKGLHVMVPVSGSIGWDTVKAFSGAIVREMAAAHPDEYVSTMSKQARTGKIFVDWFRNGRGATAIAAYSTRARPGAPIATPISWGELKSSAEPPIRKVSTFSPPSPRTDPWRELPDVKQTLSKQALRALGIKS